MAGSGPAAMMSSSPRAAACEAFGEREPRGGHIEMDGLARQLCVQAGGDPHGFDRGVVGEHRDDQLGCQRLVGCRGHLRAALSQRFGC
jgi:hypothetical protein